ncbi:vegetative cell wall protein gp1-like [Schistocerca americana]|uniref:vegetative cell wall protein gp1-like n=1 Tax=Schistocerca americana TaxID=7009 RepID=UPI001F4FC933|nr:vegetative cell wall protein gp1-like [Schistocerca americana]
MSDLKEVEDPFLESGIYDDLGLPTVSAKEEDPTEDSDNLCRDVEVPFLLLQPSGRLDAVDLVRGGFQPRLPTSLPPPGQQQQPSPLPRRQPVPLMPPAQLHPGAPQVVAPAPAVPLQSPPPSELMDVDTSAGPPSQAVAVQPVLQPLSLGTTKESDPAAPCPAPT